MDTSRRNLGRSIGARDWLDENAFKDKIKRAIRLKLDNNPERLNELKLCNLPLTHYYVYNDKIVRVPKADWIIDFLESIKSENNLTRYKMKIFTPSTDGIDHINIYSKGKTSLGRWLSNFAKSPIETEDGHFDSIEGYWYWYWLSSKDDTLRALS